MNSKPVHESVSWFPVHESGGFVGGMPRKWISKEPLKLPFHKQQPHPHLDSKERPWGSEKFARYASQVYLTVNQGKDFLVGQSTSLQMQERVLLTSFKLHPAAHSTAHRCVSSWNPGTLPGPCHLCPHIPCPPYVSSYPQRPRYGWWFLFITWPPIPPGLKGPMAGSPPGDSKEIVEPGPCARAECCETCHRAGVTQTVKPYVGMTRN